jgi:hypothetical protein
MVTSYRLPVFRPQCVSRHLGRRATRASRS